MSSSEEEDYMSAAVLGACADVRPGLVHGASKRRFALDRKKAELDKGHRERFKPKKVLEAEKREEGLETALDTGNKGFKLLAKMGFKEGMALGKAGDGRKEPVPINVKTTREGLGGEADRKRKQKELVAKLVKRRKANEATITEDYRQRMRDKFVGKKTAGELRDAQNVCMQLDTEQGWTEPVYKWYWPESYWKTGEGEEDGEEGGSSAAVVVDEEDDDDDDDDEEELEPRDKLLVINEYLRSTYWFCSWCGTQYDNQETMDKQCPGPGEEDHG